MCQERLELEVGKGLRLDKLLAKLDDTRLIEKGFFKSVLKGKQGIALIRNGERMDISDARRTTIYDGDSLVILSPITGG
jgi:sulfur carrier protein ThiS